MIGSREAEEELAMGFADWMTMTGSTNLQADCHTRELIHAIKAAAWDEGFSEGWERGHYESGDETNPYR